MGIARASLVYDAQTVCRILGLPCLRNEEAPQAADGEIVIWCGGWTGRQLQDTGKILLEDPRDVVAVPAGYYHTRIPLPQSNIPTRSNQLSMLKRLYPALRQLPATVGATALAVHLGVTGEDLLQGTYCRCAEEVKLEEDVSDGYAEHLMINIFEGLAVISNVSDSYEGSHIYLGAARKS